MTSGKKRFSDLNESMAYEIIRVKKNTVPLGEPRKKLHPHELFLPLLQYRGFSQKASRAGLFFVMSAEASQEKHTTGELFARNPCTGVYEVPHKY